MGSIQRLEKGRYRISMEGKRGEDGRRTRVTKVVRGTRDDAEVELAKMKLDAGRAVGVADSLTVDEAWRVYYEPTFDGRLAPATAGKYRGDYNHNIRPLFGDMPMSALTARTVEQGLATITAEYPRDHAFRVFRSMCNYLWNHDLISENPFSKKVAVKAPRKHEQDVMGPSALAGWTDGMRGFRHEATMLLYPYAGLRRGEGAGLRTDDLEFLEDGGVPVALARIRRTVDDGNRVDPVKTERSERTVVIAGYPAARLRYLVAGMEPGWLAREDDGRRASPHRISARYKAWCSDKRLEWYCIRQLRTTYATLSQASGIDALVTSRALGHTKLSMDYAHYFMANAPAQMAAAKALESSVSNTMYHGNKRKASLTSG